MSAIASLLGLVPGWIWAGLMAASVLHGCWIGHQRDGASNALHELQAAVAKVDLARTQAAFAANSNFRKFEHQQAAAAAELEHANQVRKQAAVGIDRSNRDDVDGLRRDVAQLDAAARRGGLPSAAAYPRELAASRRAAENARGLFLACAAEYQEVAGSAQRDVIDLGTGVGFADLVQTSAPP
ncbi:hypothetical protein J2W32_000315 [Variovorax boronicumulans]|uniref:Uncharacterized protein n=1 Tax=Variovorax boronicumulans TaxID=436515 RepID=A0AAW8CRN8_9BURK|nr:hypothetical protein [Variovorax boronicumulans]MDP9891218.1 hypothetical protein [Variovorax boronicumulans]MDQ0051286.1 hypothetical protein [Variovorax boronicumulans]